jgi:hypothetical protein
LNEFESGQIYFPSSPHHFPLASNEIHSGHDGVGRLGRFEPPVVPPSTEVSASFYRNPAPSPERGFSFPRSGVSAERRTTESRRANWNRVAMIEGSRGIYSTDENGEGK